MRRQTQSANVIVVIGGFGVIRGECSPAEPLLPRAPHYNNHPFSQKTAINRKLAISKMADPAVILSALLGDASIRGDETQHQKRNRDLKAL